MALCSRGVGVGVRVGVGAGRLRGVAAAHSKRVALAPPVSAAGAPTPAAAAFSTVGRRSAGEGRSPLTAAWWRWSPSHPSASARVAQTQLPGGAKRWLSASEEQGSDEGKDVAEPPPKPAALNIGPSQKIINLCEEVLALNVLELMQLMEIYKQRTGITDDMLMGGGGGGGGGGAAVEEAPAAEAKDAFDLKLLGFDPKAKIKVIKEVRTITGLGLKEAKELVEGAPKIIKKEIPKDEANELLEKLKEIGAEVALE